jgi:O-antigen ligase
MKRGRVTEWLFLATAFAVTFEQVHWNVAGNISLADILAIGFLVAFALGRVRESDRRTPRTAVVVLGFLGAFLLVYLIGFFNLDTSQGEAQFFKGITKFVIHFLFLFAGVAYLTRRSERFYWRTLSAFVAGLVLNAGYGVLQLLAARSGVNLNSYALNPLTGGAGTINLYGVYQGTQSIYRPQALTGDPNHLGIMLDVPLLVLTPIYLRLERGHRLKVKLGVLIAFLFLVEIATLSRSGLAGLVVGGLILAVPYRGKLATRQLVAPAAAVAGVLAVIVLSRLHYFEKIVQTRVQTGGSSTSAHFAVYDFVPKVLHSHPLFGLGLNNFSVYYQLLTGKTNWGPHSFYVALVVETGLVGTAVFAAFLWYLARKLQAGRALGRALSAARDPAAARVRPLAWGLTAALAATLVANVFYLTMSFYYFYAFVMLALALPLVFGRRTA